MKAALLSARACLLGLFLVGMACGCGGSVKIVPVKGKVTVDGELVTGGKVSLVPVAMPGESKTAGLSAGDIDANGEYKIFTDGKEGAPTGRYKVTVTPSTAAGASPRPISFNTRYSSVRDTDLSYEVVASPEPGQYDLKLSK